MHLAIYTQKSETPYIYKFSLILSLLAALALAGLFASVAYFTLDALHLNKEFMTLTLSKEQAKEKIIGLEREISALQERINYIQERSSTPGLLFEALARAYPHIPEDTVQPVYLQDSLKNTGSFIYAVQVSAYRNRDDAEISAESFRTRLDRRVFTEEIRLVNGRWFRVLVLPFSSFPEAESYAENLKKQGIISEYIIQKISRRIFNADSVKGKTAQD
ncbi:MAG TPA: SPOR domain-containing protein [archaeon]|nr:SPOR domain-containing protein [archaeon]